jgi:copper chaperone CopZ
VILRSAPQDGASADYDHLVVELTDTIQVTGIRCERCVNRLALALQDHEGLLAANANLMGRVVLTWDDGVTDRDSLVGALARAGFREREL